jgi:tRNA/rRNA methyltransferase
VRDPQRVEEPPAEGGLPGSGPAVVLVRPREEGNVGAVARAMANLGLDRLLVVEPAAPFGPTARARAVGAGFVLDAAERCDSLAAALGRFRFVVGTTSSRDRESRPVLAARALPGALRAAGVAPADTALLFGPEVSGLDNDELALSSLVVTVPCAPVQPTLNLAQAVLIVAYELWMDRLEAAGSGAAAPEPLAKAPEDQLAPAQAVAGLLARGETLLRAAGFARDASFPGVLRDLVALASRAGLREREVAILSGVVRRLSHAVAGRPGPPKARETG